MRFNFEQNFESTRFSSPKSGVSWSRGLETQIKPSGSGNKNDPRLTAVRLIQWAVMTIRLSINRCSHSKSQFDEKSKIDWSRRLGCGDFKGLTDSFSSPGKRRRKETRKGGGWGVKRLLYPTFTSISLYPEPFIICDNELDVEFLHV